MTNVLFRDAFRGKRVLVTGHTGFKGSWLTIWLHRLGARVSGYALAPPTVPSNFEASQVRALLDGHHECDIRDRDALERAVRETRPDVIFHLAAQALVRASYDDPVETFGVNVMGTVALLDVVRRVGRPVVLVVVTSDKAYENKEHVWGYRETDEMGGHDPYSASKGCTELAVASMRRAYFPPGRVTEHGVKVASARAGNVIGGGDWARDRIMTDVMAAIAAGTPIPVRNPDAVRPWQHVLEPLSGYLTLAARMLESDDVNLLGGWNFGPIVGSELSVRHLVETAIAAYGQGAWTHLSEEGARHEARQLRLSIDKAVWDLGWRPRWGCTQAVERLVRWHHAFQHGGDGAMREPCLRDIEAYECSPFLGEIAAR
ncbi:MAG: CDP-glucose 4,6-dehydratase [Proteobacteria bacterium]|nr:CDP-glucose 4,6-dehydratase [Pseudomonadota bacterium]